MMASLRALSIVVEKASSNNISGSAMLNLLQSQVDNPIVSICEHVVPLAFMCLQTISYCLYRHAMLLETFVMI